jgi:peptide/nickel transport system permease protein
MSFLGYLAKRTVVLGITLILVLLATIMVAGGFGIVDRVAEAAIRQQVNLMIRTNPNLARLPEEERVRIMQTMIDEERKAIGLDKPFIERVPKYLFQALSWDFGNALYLRSASGSSNINDMIAEVLPRTILLFTTGALISAIVGIALGLLMARRPLGLFDKVMTSFAVVSNSMPLWWVGMLLILLLGFTLKVLPPGGYVSVPAPTDPVAYAFDVLYHMMLPLIAVVLTSFGGWAYTVRSLLLDTFQQDFILVARAKGLSENDVMYKHALRATAPPIVTLLLLSIVGSMGGAIISEVVFNWAGMGRLFADAIGYQDVPVIIAETYVFSFLYVAVFLVLEVLYGLLDPRVRTGVSAQV